MVEKKAHRGRLWKVFGSEQFKRGMWEYFTLKREGARITLADDAQENKKGSKVSGNRSLPSKKFWNKSKEVRIQLSVPRQCAVLSIAMKHGNRESLQEEYMKEGKLCVNGPLNE